MSIKGKISIRGANNKASASVNAGPVKVGLQIDASNFFKGFVTSQNRLEELKLELARMVIPFYSRLIYRTPVWRGTARMHWSLNVDKSFNRSGQGAGKRTKGVNKDLIDTGLDKIANKAGSPKTATKYVSFTGKPDKEGREPVKSQTQYGKKTTAVTNMIKSAERNIDKNFKITGGGPRSATVSVITISNDLPYLKFLEGANSIYGATYTKGSRWWQEKEGGADFVNPQNDSKGSSKEKYALGQYRKGFIQNTVYKFKGELTKFMATNKPKTYRK